RLRDVLHRRRNRHRFDQSYLQTGPAAAEAPRAAVHPHRGDREGGAGPRPRRDGGRPSHPGHHPRHPVCGAISPPGRSPVGFLLSGEAMSDHRALVVDDDEPIRTLLTRIVEHEGFAVETAKDGREAIARIDADGYDVILL